MSVSRLSHSMFLLMGLVYGYSASAQQSDPGYEMGVVKLADDLFVLRSLPAGPGDVTVLITDEGVLLVDDKFESDFERIVETVAQLTDRPIRYVVNTHLHSDHTGGNALMRMAGVTIIASTNTRRSFETYPELHDALPDVTTDTHVRLYVGGVPVDTYYFGPSHTNSDVVVHFPDHGVIAMGDMMATTGEWCLCGVHYYAGGSGLEWANSITNALSLDFDTVVTGHTGVTDRAGLEAYRDSIVREVDLLSELARQGRSRSDILIALEWDGNTPSYVQPLDRNVDEFLIEYRRQ